MEEEGLIRLLNYDGEEFDVTCSQDPNFRVSTVSLTKLRELLRQVEDAGPSCLIKSYHEVLSVQRNLRKSGFTDDKHLIVITALDIIKEGMSRMRDEFDVEDPEFLLLSENKQKVLRKSAVVLMFLFQKLVTEVECQAAGNKEKESITGNGNGEQGNSANLNSHSKFSFWPETRHKLMRTLRKFLQNPLEKIRNTHPEAASHGFRCITVTICSTIKNVYKDLDEYQGLQKDILEIFGILCDRYNQGDSLITKLVPMLALGDGFSKIICSCLCHIEDERISKSLIVKSINEAAEFYEFQESKHSFMQKGVASFLKQIGGKRPMFCLDAIPAIKHFLCIETNSTLRNAALTISADLLSLDPKNIQKDHGEGEDSDFEGDKEVDICKISSQRDDLLKTTLIAHLSDVNAHVRSKALYLIGELIARNKLSLTEVTVCLSKAIHRLQDSMSSVRKSALVLLKAVVETYPLSVKFSSDHYQKGIEDSLEKLVSFYSEASSDRCILLKEVVHRFYNLSKSGYAEICFENCKKRLNGQFDNLTQIIKEKLMQGLYWEACEIRYADLKLKSMVCEDNAEGEKPSVTVRFFFKLMEIEVEEGELYLSALNERLDSDEINKCYEIILLYSGWKKIGEFLRNTISMLLIYLERGVSDEVVEVMQLLNSFCEAEYELPSELLPNILCSIGKVIKTKEKLIPHLMKSFTVLYFPPAIRNHDLNMVKRLLLLVKSTASDLRDTMSLIIERLYQTDFITRGVVEKLWDAFSLKAPMWTREDSIFAVFLLGVISRQDRANLMQTVSSLAHIGLTARAFEDYELTEAVLDAVLRACTRSKNHQSTHLEFLRFPSSHLIFVNVINFLDQGLITVGNLTDRVRLPRILDLCIRIIYSLSLKPEDAIQKLLVLSNDMLQRCGHQLTIVKSEFSPQNLEEWHLIWYLSLMTAILGSHIQYYEKTVIPELRRRKTLLREKSRRYSADRVQSNMSGFEFEISSNNGLPKSTPSATSFTSLSVSSSSLEMREILGSHEAEVEHIKTYLYNLTDAPGAFRVFKNLTLEICDNYRNHRTFALVFWGVKALLKIMSVSPRNIQQNIKTLTRIWEATDEKFNSLKIAIAMNCAPLVAKCPNEMEEIIFRFIQGLKNTNKKVRLACLDVVVFLGLGKLIRNQDILTPCAICLCDNSLDVREGAKHFFNQITKEEGNALTNSVPDMISELLSNNDVTGGQSEQILSFILAKIKTKQYQALIERILHKFKTTERGRKCVVLAFSLTVFSHNEKTIDLMMEKIQWFSDKLDEEVYQHFISIVETVKRKASPDLLIKVDTFYTMINEHREKLVHLHQLGSDGNRVPIGTESTSSSTSSSFDEEEKESETDSQKLVIESVSESGQSDSPDENESDQRHNGVEESQRSRINISRKRRRIESDSED